MADERLKLAVQHIYETLISALTTAGIDVPDHRYIHAGAIAHDFVGDDCADAFVVSYQLAFTGQLPAGGRGAALTAGTSIDCAMPLSVQVAVTLLRCVPTLGDGVAPTADDLNVSGEELLRDGWTLLAAIVDKASDGTLKQDHVNQVGIATAGPVGPLGGVGGNQVVLNVAIL